MSSSSTRLIGVDWLRGIAVGMVLLLHAPMWPEFFPWPISTVIASMHRAGWAGVDLFLVLSGFLVSGLLFREHQQHGDVQLGRFLLRRGLKIYPAFYAMVLIATAIHLLMGMPVKWPALAADITFTQNYLGCFYGHTWSLAVEEHFYLAAALGIWWLSRRGHMRLVMPICLGVMATALAGRLITAATTPYHYSTNIVPTHLRMDSLAMGVVSGYLYHFHGKALARWVARHRLWLWPASAALASPIFLIGVEHRFMHTLGLTLIALGFTGLLLLVTHIQDSTFLSFGPVSRLMTWVGVHSYSIYLWHWPVRSFELWITRNWLGDRVPYPIEVAVYFICGIGGGVLAAKLLETPVLKLRDRLWPSRRRIVDDLTEVAVLARIEPSVVPLKRAA